METGPSRWDVQYPAIPEPPSAYGEIGAKVGCLSCRARRVSHPHPFFPPRSILCFQFDSSSPLRSNAMRVDRRVISAARAASSVFGRMIMGTRAYRRGNEPGRGRGVDRPAFHVDLERCGPTSPTWIMEPKC